MTERTERCETCRYVLEVGVEPDTGECHKCPPSHDGWPPVSLEDGWCGEWAALATAFPASGTRDPKPIRAAPGGGRAT